MSIIRPIIKPILQPIITSVIDKKISSEPAFRFEVKTAGADTFQLPLEVGGTYDFNIDWGDGSESDITVYNHADTNHSYSGAGTYNVVITGTCYGWRFANAGDTDLIYDISEWGPLRLGNNNGYFYGCNNLTVSATDALDLTGTTTLYRFMRNCSAVTTIPGLSKSDFSNVEVINHAFNNTSLDQNLGNIDISSLTNADGMLVSVKMSTTNWSDTLIGWLAQRPALAIVIGGGTSKRNAAGTVAYNVLVAAGCTITDGGEE